MARIPDEFSIGSPQFRNVMTMPQYDASALSAPARGQQAIGEAIGKMGKALGGLIEAAGAEEDQKEKYRLETSFVDLQQGFDNDVERRAREDMPEDGTGFQSSTVDEYTKRAREWLKGVPDKDKPYWDARLAKGGAGFEDRARRYEYDQYDRWFQGDMKGREEGVGKTIQERHEDPDAVRDAIDSHAGVIRASRLSPARKEQALKRFGSWAELQYVAARQNAINNATDANGDPLSPEEKVRRFGEIGNELKRILPPGFSPEGDGPDKPQGPQAELKPISFQPMPAGLRDEIARPRQGGVQDIKGFVVHETASPTREGQEPTLGGFVSWSNQSNTGANYYIGKDGTVYQMAGDDRYLNHTDAGRGRSGDARPEFMSANTLSVEIITRKGEKPNAAQIEAAQNLVRSKAKEYGFDPVKDVYGHGELAVGHREASEGMDVVKRLRSGGQMVASADGKIEVGVNKFAPSKTPGLITAAADQDSRATNDEGYGDKLTGKITVNGRTYEWVSGGTKGSRGSIPTGTYAIQRYTSAAQRASEGKSLRWDSFELNAAQDDIGKAAKQNKRDGLLIHDGNQGQTAGCIGIQGDFEQFKKDLQAEQAKNGGKLHIQVGTKSQLAEIEKATKTAGVAEQPAVPPLAQRATLLGLNPPKTAAAGTEGAKPPLPGRIGSLGGPREDDTSGITPPAPSLAQRPSQTTAALSPDEEALPLAVSNGPNDVQTAFDGTPDNTPLSKLSTAEREELFSRLPPEVTKPYTVGPGGEKASAADLITVGELKRLAQGAVRGAELERGDLGEPIAPDQAAPDQGVLSDNPYGPERPQAPRKQYEFKYLSPQQIQTAIRNNQVAQRSLFIGDGGLLPGAINKVGQTGIEPRMPDGRTMMEAAKDVLMPNQYTEWQGKMALAKEYHRIVSPLYGMSELDIRDTLRNLETVNESDSPTVAAQKKKLAPVVGKIVKDLLEAGRKDPAAAVTRSPEVAEAYRQADEAKKLYAFGTNPDGSVSRRQVGEIRRAAREATETVIEAKIAAQENRFGERYKGDDDFTGRIRVITNAEAEALLVPRQVWKELDENEKRRVLAEGAAVSDSLYGRYSKRAFNEAVRHLVTSSTARDDLAVTSIANKLAQGAPITRYDMRKAQMLREAGMPDSFIQPTNTDRDFVVGSDGRFERDAKGNVKQSWQQQMPSREAVTQGANRVFAEPFAFPAKPTSGPALNPNMPAIATQPAAAQSRAVMPTGAGRSVAPSEKEIQWVMQDFARRAPIFNEKYGKTAAENLVTQMASRIGQNTTQQGTPVNRSWLQQMFGTAQ